MTHTHALRRLLEHGPLQFGELLEITGWTLNAVRSAIFRLEEAGVVASEKCGPHRNLYRLV